MAANASQRQCRLTVSPQAATSALNAVSGVAPATAGAASAGARSPACTVTIHEGISSAPAALLYI
jgi:hypothetical protein